MHQGFDMKLCLKCETPHEKSGKYCCRSCANSRVFSETAIEKKRSKSKEFWSQFDVAGRKAHHKEKMLKYDFDEHQRKVQEANLKNSWDRPYEEMQHGSLRKRLLHERNNTCEECGCKGEYNGKPLSLELEHVDGNRNNNKIENLKILCPNCHSQTPTFRGRNVRLRNLAKRNIPREQSR
jgi:5-methylcytosine-specific restriction endonuclease McrA